jgi:excisionase family DNA binding protein
MKLTYSILEACDLLSVGRTTLYAAIRKGELKACKIGRRTLITHDALALWLKRLPDSLEVRSRTRAMVSDEGVR